MLLHEPQKNIDWVDEREENSLQTFIQTVSDCHHRREVGGSILDPK